MSEGSPSAVRHCPWCGAVQDGTSLNCRTCGATLTNPRHGTAEDWSEVPPLRDMVRLEVGQSSCQVEGAYVPAADMNLVGEDGVYFAHHVLLWKDPSVRVARMPLKGMFKRMFAGLPLIMTQAHGPGHIAFSRDAAGELIAVPLHSNQAIDVREHAFLVATHSIAYDWFNSGIWYRTRNGNDTDTHYPVGMFMDRFSCSEEQGLLLLHAAGNVFVRTLAAHETVLVKPTALLFKEPHVQMQLHIEVPQQRGTTFARSWTVRYLWLRLCGPGRVAIQSVFERMENEGCLVGSSAATTRSWS
jgi:uncharacterized protein (AIM24 family)